MALLPLKTNQGQKAYSDLSTRVHHQVCLVFTQCNDVGCGRRRQCTDRLGCLFFSPQWLWFSCRAWDVLRVRAGELFRNHMSHMRWLIHPDTCWLAMFPIKLLLPFFISPSSHPPTFRTLSFFSTPVTGSRKLEYGDSVWHEECFMCRMCEQPIGAQAFIPDKGDYYCVPCYEGKFAPRCSHCKQVIFDKLQYSTISSKEILCNGKLLRGVT